VAAAGASAALGTLPVVVGAVSLCAEAGGALYWVAAGIVLATTGAVANAWVLLVGILRSAGRPRPGRPRHDAKSGMAARAESARPLGSSQSS
jgi:hypothetical protein